MTTETDERYAAWLAEFTRLALEQELDWLVPSDPEVRRAAFEQGQSPQEELAALKDICEWRGCGCGG